MRCLKGTILFVLTIVSCIFLFKSDAKAADASFFKEYSGDYCVYKEYHFTLKYKCKMTIYMECEESEDDGYYDGLLITIYDNDENYKFGKQMFSSGIFQKTITLMPGKYTLDIESDGAYYLILDGEYCPELSQKNITLQEGKSKTLKVSPHTKKIRWSSSNKSIVTVNGKGVVKAKKAGKAIITAKCAGYTLKCKVIVEKKPVSYKDISKKMKDFARRNNGFKFKNVDVGRICRVYAGSLGDIDNSKVDSELYSMYAILWPYIELVKKSNSKTEIRIKIYGELFERALYDSTSLHCCSINTRTSNRMMDFSMTHTYGKNFYNYAEGYYEGKMKGYSTVFTSSKVDSSKLKKFETMLGQNSLSMRIVSSDGAYYQISIPYDARSNWKKLVKEYRLLLKQF